ncbi:MAG: tryptophan 2,3-dioxygenase family protein [Imperialibacter sp.]|uniref:tryptophan 2,3-dioxygenase family protein n=1 Tax=Imperialibacter sp. TaxID=2038411 RepID=UPI0032EB97B9
MSNSEKDQKIVSQIRKLEEKYEAMGQDLSSYLDGLLHADYLTYWDYIHLDTLLSLQTPRTGFPDEKIFILYHQITELYFQLIRNEMKQLSFDDADDINLFKVRVKRILRYWKHLVDSFEVMIDGMEPSQFLKFRMALLPASGFQSAQYRLIEIGSTPLINLTDKAYRESVHGEPSVEFLIDNLYWKRGATELATSKKTLTLRQFEDKYHREFIQFGEEIKHRTIWDVYRQRYEKHGEEELIELMRALDMEANVKWPLSHFKSATRYLQREPDVIAATGGTNWQKYLPPRFQMVTFFPGLWSETELHQWGKSTDVVAAPSQ